MTTRRPDSASTSVPRAARPRRCLVTGGAGFIGSHIVDSLVAAGHEVAVLDNLSSGKREYVAQGVRLFELDVTADTSSAFREFQPDVVLHEAAQISVSVSVREPEEDARVNILGSLRVIRTAVEHGVQKIVYASSAAAYGPLDTLPLEENMRALPVSGYGISKYTVEHYLKAAATDWGLPEWAALRYANVYGPRQNPHGEAGVVAIFCRQLLAGKSPTIFDDGEMTRDYIFVEDVAKANRLAVEADLSGAADPVYNIATGEETSTNEVFRGLQEALRSDLPPVHGPPRPGDVRRCVLSPRRAREELDWRAETRLGDGLRRTADYFAVEAATLGAR